MPSINKDMLTVILPTLNEEEGIGPVIDELHEHGYKNIIVVDGGSTDKTVEIAKKKGVTVIPQEGKGKTAAIKTAIQYVKTPYTLIMDADYTYPAKYIDTLLKYADKNDEVIGARLNGRENMPILNRLGNKILNTAFNLLFGTKLRDVCSGMYLLKTEIAREISFETQGFSAEVEIAAHVASMTGKIAEIPIEYRKRLGKPKLKKSHGFHILSDIIRLTWRYNPTFFIMALGSTLAIPAFTILAWVAYELSFKGIKHHVWAMLGTVMASTGITSLILAIMALYLKRMEYRIIQRIREIQKNIKQ